MIEPRELIRNHMLAATMLGRWESLTEIVRALKRDGTRILRSHAWTHVLELSRDGVHDLKHRMRASSGVKEYRLHVKEGKIMKTRKFERTPFATRRG